MFIKISNTRVDNMCSRVIDNLDDKGFILTSEDMAIFESILETKFDAKFMFSTRFTGSNHWWLKCYEDDCNVYKFSSIKKVQARAPLINNLILDEYLKWICNMARLLVRDRTVKFDYHIPHNNVISKLIKWYDRQELCEALTEDYEMVPGVLQLIHATNNRMPKEVYDACFSTEISVKAKTRLTISASIAGEYNVYDFALNNLICFKSLTYYMGNIYTYSTGISPKINEVIDEMGLTDYEAIVARRLLCYLRRV